MVAAELCAAGAVLNAHDRKIMDTELLVAATDGDVDEVGRLLIVRALRCACLCGWGLSLSLSLSLSLLLVSMYLRVCVCVRACVRACAYLPACLPACMSACLPLPTRSLKFRVCLWHPSIFGTPM